MQRRAVMRGALGLPLVGPLLLAGCGGDDDAPGRAVFAPLRYDYLVPLRLNVGSVEVADGPPPGPLDAQNPAPPGPTLRRMAQDRLGAGGSAGRAVFTVDEAGISRAGGGLAGVMAVHLDILRPDGSRAGYAEARVTRQAPLPRRGDLPGALYDMTRAMMDDMNVEFEFQVRRALQEWLQGAETAPAAAPVQRQDLVPPGSGGPGRPVPAL